MPDLVNKVKVHIEERVEAKSERVEAKPERPEAKPELVEAKPERPDAKPERPDAKPERPDAYIRLGGRCRIDSFYYHWYHWRNYGIHCYRIADNRVTRYHYRIADRSERHADQQCDDKGHQTCNMFDVLKIGSHRTLLLFRISFRLLFYYTFSRGKFTP